MLPIISVIVPAYGVEDYIRECVDSLLKQPFDNIEVILVDDGSPDNCPAICDEYAKQDIRVKVVHKENGGLVSARKAGANVATGVYVANVDGDDWVSSKFFEKIFGIINEYGPDVIYYNSNFVIDGQTKEVHANLKSGFYNKQDIERDLFPKLIEDVYGKDLPHPICNHVIKREIYKECQMNVDDRVKIGEDGACMKPVIYHAKSLYVMDDCLDYYRINSASMTHSRKPFDVDVPLILGKTLEKQINMQGFDFQEQIYRYVVHNLFNACASQFYSGKRYEEVVKELNKCLEEPYYQLAIKECRFNKKNIQGNLARFALKHKCYILMKLYCISRFKAW